MATTCTLIARYCTRAHGKPPTCDLEKQQLRRSPFSESAALQTTGCLPLPLPEYCQSTSIDLPLLQCVVCAGLNRLLRGFSVNAIASVGMLAYGHSAPTSPVFENMVRSALPSESATIAGSYVRALLRAVADQGHDPDVFVEVHGLTRSYLEACESIPAAQFGRLYQQAMLLLEDESLGMVSGGRVRTGTFRMMCLCVVHSPTLQGVIERAGEFLDVCNGMSIKPQVLPMSSSAAVGFATVKEERDRSLKEILESDGPMRVRTSLFMWNNLLSWFAGRPVPLTRVDFNFPEPATGAQWSRLFRVPVYFDCERSLLRFDKSMLTMPNVQSERTLEVFLKSAPYRLIVPSWHDQKLSDRVLALLGNDLMGRLPGAETISDQLGMSVSTLRRQLLEEGTSFQRLKDERRLAVAMQYLATRDLTYTEIAGLLGFNEASAFFRAFKRLTGMTPTQFRDSL